MACVGLNAAEGEVMELPEACHVTSRGKTEAGSSCMQYVNVSPPPFFFLFLWHAHCLAMHSLLVVRCAPSPDDCKWYTDSGLQSPGSEYPGKPRGNAWQGSERAKIRALVVLLIGLRVVVIGLRVIHN